MDTRSHAKPLKVVEKTFHVIEVMSRSESSLPLTEIARKVGQPKATVFRILFTLKEMGYVEQDAATQAYRLTERLSRQSQGEEISALKSVARPYLEKLLALFEQTVCLAVLDRRQVYYIDIVEGLRSIRMAAAAGTYAPPHCTSLGKSILAFLDREEVLRLLSRDPLVMLTEKTIASVPLLMKALQQVRQKGFAIDDEETEIGARCVGVPIFNSQGKPFAAMSVSGPTSHIRGNRIPQVAQALKEASKRISERLGLRIGQRTGKISGSHE